MATATTISQCQSTPNLPSDRTVEPASGRKSPSPLHVNSTFAISMRNDTGNTTCDACYRKRSRCDMNGRVNKCQSCDYHRQECTFVLSSQLGKRKLDESSRACDSAKRQATGQAMSSSENTLEAHSQTRTALANLQNCAPLTTQYIGMTTELEPLLLDYLPLDQSGQGKLAAARVRKFSDDGTYMRIIDGPQAGLEASSISVEAIENLVTPFGPSLVEKFFQNLHPTFPVLLEDEFRSLYQAKEVPPVLLASIYFVCLKWLDPGPGIQTLRKPDAARLESTAIRLLNESFVRPQLATVQAGLLLSQKSTLFSPRLMSQLVTAAFDMGLHQDCSSWKLQNCEKGLRKRLAWALYVQDKWCALAHGRPSHIFAQNWTVQELSLDDFEGCYSKSPSSNEQSTSDGVGPLVFSRLIVLTTILSDILDTFYTLRATQDFSNAGDQSTRIILERAKPIQIRLKDWFSQLPPELKMDSSLNPLDNIPTKIDTAANGGLHLAYFATEITLHRCIIRSINPQNADDYLTYICRSAAKTRLISAMDFVNRLRPNHLRAFWPAASRTNFALIVAFGMLLRITAQTREEEEFYRCRLNEYRWTLEVSRRHAAFLGWVVECLDVMSGVVRGAGLHKPVLEEYMARMITPASKYSRTGPGQFQRAVPASDSREQHEERSSGTSDNSSVITRRGYNQSMNSLSSSEAMMSPATSVSGGSSRRGSRSGGGGDGMNHADRQRHVMNVSELT